SREGASCKTGRGYAGHWSANQFAEKRQDKANMSIADIAERLRPMDLFFHVVSSRYPTCVCLKEYLHCNAPRIHRELHSAALRRFSWAELSPDDPERCCNMSYPAPPPN